MNRGKWGVVVFIGLLVVVSLQGVINSGKSKKTSFAPISTESKQTAENSAQLSNVITLDHKHLSSSASTLELDIVPNQILVKFQEDFQSYSHQEKNQLLALHGVTIIEEYPYAGDSALYGCSCLIFII